MNPSRKEFFKQAGAIVLGVAAGAGGTSLVSYAAPQSAAPTLPNPPWGYSKLDPQAAAERAYKGYYEAACMYGAFTGIVGELAAKAGPPYSSFPAMMMKYGEAGVVGWGTLCGALNGAAAAVYLLYAPAAGKPIINELYAWYGVEPLPVYRPRNPKRADTIVSSVSDSQLCHISITKWCLKSGFKSESPQRAERCARLAASVAYRAVELLNLQADGKFRPAHATTAAAARCLSCHGKGGMVDNVHISGQTSCTLCHADLSKHPVPIP